MKRKTLILMLFIAIASAFSYNLFALSITDILAKTDKTDEVQTAQTDVEIAERQLTLLGYPGNTTVSAQGTSKSGDGYTSLNGYIYLNIPTGLNSKTKANLEKAYDTLKLAQLNLKETAYKEVLKLLTLYENTWLAQQEIEVLEAELQAYEAIFNITKEKYKAGTASLAELTKAEENYSKATENLLQGKLRERIAWLEMTYNTGVSDYPKGGSRINPATEEILIKYIPENQSIPKPPELTAHAYKNLYIIKAQETKIQELEREIERINSVTSDDLQLDLKGFFNYGQHSAFADYNFLNPGLNIGYSFPITTIGNPSDTLQNSTTSGSEWNLGATLSVSVKLGNNERLEKSYTESILKKEKIKLESIRESVALEIRSKYQQWLNTQDYEKQAERNLNRVIESLNIVKTKAQLGLANKAEVEEAKAMVKRAQWNLYKMQVEREKARLAVYISAGMIPPEYKDFTNF